MEITAKQQNQLNIIGRQHKLKLLLLHGSYATGKQHPGSDLDVAYLPSQSLDFKQQLQLHSDLADVFGDNAERELDLKSMQNTNPLFLFETTRHSHLLYGSKNDYRDFCLHAEMLYHDTSDLRALEHLLTRRLIHRLKNSHVRH